MPQFRYRALNSQGHELEGTLSAPDANAAVVQLGRQGLRLKSIEEGVSVVRAQPVQPRQFAQPTSQPVQINVPVQRPRQVPSASGPRYGVKRSRRSTYNDRQFFFAQLGGLLRSGISPADALHTILARSSASKFQAQVDDMAKMCADGMSLAESMEHYPNMFSRGIVGAVRAGETGGYLPEACETLSKQQKETRKIFNMFAGLLVSFPWFIVLVFLGISIAFGIDRGIDGIVQGSQESTVQSGIGAAWTGIVGTLFVLTVVGIFVAYFGGRSQKLRGFRHSVGLSMPMFKKRALNENLAHFSYHLGRLAQSGLSPFASWQLAAHAAPNEAYSGRLLKLSETLNENTRLSELLYRSKLFPRETAQLVETGEMTGDLPLALDQVMDFGREQEKQANMYIGMKAGCWTFMLFFLGGSVVFLIVYVTYLTGAMRIIDEGL